MGAFGLRHMRASNLRKHMRKMPSDAKPSKYHVSHIWRILFEPPCHAVSYGESMIEMSREDFEIAVGDALDLIPTELMDKVDNVVFLVEDEPPDDLHPDTLGLYEGVPITERDWGWESGALPDRIYIFRGPILRMCGTEDEVVKEVAVTVIHEVAHYFGIDDDRLEELGWD